MKERVHTTSFVLLLTSLVFLMPIGDAELYAAGNSSYNNTDIHAIQSAYNRGNYSRVIQLVQQSRERTQQIPAEMLFYEGASYFQLGRNEPAKTSLNEFLNRARVNHNLTKDVVITLNQIHLDEAHEVKAYQTALNRNTPSSIRAYLNRYPQGRYVVEMNQRLDDAVFRQASSKFDYERYLREFPNGRNVAAARQQISNIENRDRISSIEYRIRSLDNDIARYRSMQNSKTGKGVLLLGFAGAGAFALIKADDFDDDDDDLVGALLTGGGAFALLTGLMFGYSDLRDAAKYRNWVRRGQAEKRDYERELESLRNPTSLNIGPAYDIRNGAFGVRLTLNF